jgi:hypothetical protein
MNGKEACYEHWIILDDEETALRYAVALRALIDYSCMNDFDMPGRIQIILDGSTIRVKTDIPWNDEVNKLAKIITDAECEFRSND